MPVKKKPASKPAVKKQADKKGASDKKVVKDAVPAKKSDARTKAAHIAKKKLVKDPVAKKTSSVKVTVQDIASKELAAMETEFREEQSIQDIVAKEIAALEAALEAEFREEQADKTAPTFKCKPRAKAKTDAIKLAPVPSPEQAESVLGGCDILKEAAGIREDVTVEIPVSTMSSGPSKVRASLNAMDPLVDEEGVELSIVEEAIYPHMDDPNFFKSRDQVVCEELAAMAEDLRQFNKHFQDRIDAIAQRFAPAKGPFAFFTQD
jgi:hypothetical protein